jgi:uracil phosphoribosyltransferase
MHVLSFPATLRAVHQQSSSDYSKLPSTLTVDMVYLLDPLIATGGTAIAAINMITDWGVPGPHNSPSTPAAESNDLI